jgi:hypothetical protein
VTLGPPIGDALLITGNYDVLWIGVTALETLLAWADPLAGRLRAGRAA